MAKTKKFVINKVYNKEPERKIVVDFSDCSKELYLGLLENKDKVKPELLDVEFKPDPNKYYYKSPNNVKISKIVNPDRDDSSQYSDSETDDSRDRDDDDDKDKDKDRDKDKEKEKDKEKDKDRDRNKDRGKDKDNDDKESDSDSESGQDEADKLLNKLKEKPDKNKKHRRVAPMINGSAHKSPAYRSITRTNPPPLSELLNKDSTYKKYIPKLENFKDKTAEENAKRLLQQKFQLLRRQYKHADIPEFSVHSDYTIMKNTYDDTVRQVKLDATVCRYKQWLSNAFFAVEFVLGYYFGLDMNGYAEHQQNEMDSYEALLFELGEKQYMPGMTGYPVEVRLIAIVGINTVSFLFFRYVQFAMPGANVPKQRTVMQGPNVSNV